MDEMGKPGSLYLFLKRVAELAVVEALGKRLKTKGLKAVTESRSFQQNE